MASILVATDGGLHDVGGGDPPAFEDREVTFLASGPSGVLADCEIVGAGNASEIVRRLSLDVPNISVRAPVDRRDYSDLLASADVQLVIQRRILHTIDNQAMAAHLIGKDWSHWLTSQQLTRLRLRPTRRVAWLRSPVHDELW